MKSSQAAAFMDLDGTLYDGYIWAGLTRHHLRHRLKLASLFTYLGLHLPLWPLLKLKLISPDTFYGTWGAHMAWLVRGVSIKQARGIWERLIDDELLPKLRPEMEEAIGTHKAAGHPVILLSGTFQPLLDALARRLDLSGAIATPLIERNGKFTGRIEPPLNVGRGKLERMKNYLLHTQPEIDLARSFLYTDSIVDLPVLIEVGYPVAVYPDDDLDRLARARSWKIISSR